MALNRIIAVGKLKEKYWQEAQAEYLKRLQPYLKLELKEVADLPCPEGASAAQENQVRQGEAALIENLILPKSYLIVLDIQGKELSSPELAQFLTEHQMSGRDLTLVIGGSLGLTDELRRKADFRWSFSKLTFPHQLFRIMLLEQLYRGCKIRRGERYHK
ncbi:MAG TPA: 23S rRNA (pseudouridine(1915)-N(3))-methyltransferase RlmH [Bacillota bacterium]|nr:23S rRNA (pseudouridine(1915)-N(3))-methyltransferase RlmH [Bacillota bacterium]